MFSEFYTIKINLNEKENNSLVSKVYFGFNLFFTGISILPALIAFILANKSEKLYNSDPDVYINSGKIKKGKIMSIIGIILNLIIVGVTIWTLTTIGWGCLVRRACKKMERGFRKSPRLLSLRESIIIIPLTKKSFDVSQNFFLFSCIINLNTYNNPA